MIDTHPIAPKPENKIAIVGLFLVLFALAIFLQVQNGGFISDFGGHADEAAHVVTSLMVRDYLAGPVFHLQHPMHYAETYYDHFPKVALGHYPPGFYLLMGLWLLPMRTKTAGVLTSLQSKKLLPLWGARACGLLFVLLPLVQTYTVIVMSDIMVVVLAILAIHSFQSFLNSGKLAPALCFGLLAALAILTKAAGLFLALVPPLSIALSGRWATLKNWRLWMAPAPVIVLALPWMAYSWKITADGLSSEPLRDYIHEAIPFYGQAMVRELSWVGLGLLGVSIVARFVKGKPTNGQDASWAVHWATIGSLLVFYIMTPSGMDERYLLPLIPSALTLALYGAASLGALLSAKRSNNSNPARWTWAACLIGASFLLACVWRPSGKLYTGAQICMDEAMAHCPANPIFLVSGSANTEGALVAAAALTPNHQNVTVIRATKALATTDWMGRNYVSKFAQPAELLAYLTQSHVNCVIMDTPDVHSTFPHEHQLAEALGNSNSSSPASPPFHLLTKTTGLRRNGELAPLQVPMLVYEKTTP